MLNNYRELTNFFLVLILIAAIPAAVAQTASEIAGQPKSQADNLLDDLDSDSTILEVEASSDSVESADASSNSQRIAPYSTLFINFVGPDDETVSDLVPSEKIFTIDAYGYLIIEGIGRFKLSGLTESEAALRLSAEPSFEAMNIEVSVLPVEAEGEQILEIFGQSLFQAQSSGTNTSDIPVPADYIIGPGDEVSVQLYGATNETHTLEVTREGLIEFPELGPQAVAGQTYAEMRENLAKLAESRLIGTQAFVTLGELKSTNILVVGEVESPGPQLVGSLSSIIDVLAASGGISETGSFRHVEVKRGGQTIASVDLYDLLLKGNLSRTVSLQSGDVIFVPPVKHRVVLSGEVKRPAIYELNKEISLEAVLAMAGGVTSTAYSENIQIERVDNERRVLIEANFGTSTGRNLKIEDGDKIVVAPVSAVVDGVIRIFGAVERSGEYAWSKGMRVSDLIPSISMLKAQADLEYGLLVRQLPGVTRAEVNEINLVNIFQAKGSEPDLFLQPNDRIYILSVGKAGQRQYLLSNLIDELKKQASLGHPAKVVSVEGGVIEPGTYPLSQGMRVSDLLMAAGKLKETAISHRAELTRIVNTPDGERVLEHMSVRLDDILAGNKDADLVLSSYDSLTVMSDPRWVERRTVELSGEVKYPGVYPITNGESLSSVIERAGGLTDVAFAEGAFLSRVSIKEAEQKEMLALADRIEASMKATILERVDENLRPAESLQVASDVIELMRNAEAPGRVVIDLPRILEETRGGKISDLDLMLLPDDSVYIPPFREAVTVIGEVNHPTTHAFKDAFSMMDYVDASGGITLKSKKKLAFIIRANGSAAPKNAWWRGDVDIHPGDTIVVPLDVEKIRKLKAWAEISGIVSNFITPTASAVNAAAAWKSAEAAEIQAEAIERSLDSGQNTPGINVN